MFRNRDSGLSNTLYWFFEVWNKTYNGELLHCSEGKATKLQTLRAALFASHKRGT